MAYVPPGMMDVIQRQYAMMNANPPPAPAPTMARPYAGDPFGGMKAGENRSFNSFTANQVGDPAHGGIQIVAGHSNPIGTIQSLVMNGMAPADAIHAVGTAAAANSEDVRTSLYPTESAANVGLTRAQTNVAGANVGLIGAQAGLARAGIDTAKAELPWIPLSAQSTAAQKLAEAANNRALAARSMVHLAPSPVTEDDYLGGTGLWRNFGKGFGLGAPRAP